MEDKWGASGLSYGLNVPFHSIAGRANICNKRSRDPLLLVVIVSRATVFLPIFSDSTRPMKLHTHTHTHAHTQNTQDTRV